MTTAVALTWTGKTYHRPSMDPRKTKCGHEAVKATTREALPRLCRPCTRCFPKSVLPN